MNEAEKVDLSARFYFMGPTEDPEDSLYVRLYPKLLKQVANRIVQRGHVVGFHPGGQSYVDENRWQKQRHGLERILELSVFEGRQHQLRFSVERTWDLWERAGMRVDSTLHYPCEPGFRAGTCHAFQAYSLRDRETLNLIERSTQISEFGFFGEKYLNLEFEQAISECQQIVETVRNQCGDLTLLYHTGPKRPIEVQFLHELLKLI